MKKVIVSCLALVMTLSLSMSSLAAPVKDSIVIGTSQEPVRFFSCGPEGSNSSDYIVLYNIYDTLVQLTNTGEIIPALATKWEVSDDGLSYKFFLRDDVFFHNGDKMTADDVKYTFDYNIQTAIGKALLINYSSTEIIDDTTIVVHLNNPFAAFINGLTARAGQIISKKYMEENGVQTYLEKPIGTGAYMFNSRVSGDTVTLEANESYWGGAPAIKKVYIRTMTDVSTQIISLEAGDIDVLLSPAVSNMVNLDTSGEATWAYASSAARVTMTFNCNEGTIGSNYYFRKAVQAATNKADIIAGVMEGYAVEGDIDMVPGYTGRPDEYLKVAYDLNAAKENLEKSGYKNEEFSILVQSGTKNESVAQILQSQLMEIGINCTINATDTATFNSVWYSGAGYSAIIRTSDSSLMDADCLTAYFALTAVAAKSNTFPKMQELNDLLMKGRITQDATARKEVYREAVDIITEEAYQVVFFYDLTTIAYNENITGITPNPLFVYRFRDWSW